MSTLEGSFARLRAGDWVINPQIAAANDSSCKFQALADGDGKYIYDEYSVLISEMPRDLPPEAYLLEFARDPNTTVSHGLFNVMNTFTKRSNAEPKVGDIYDICIVGVINCSIVLVALSEGFGASSGDAWFDIQTVSCEKHSRHPENGAREFGFEYVSGGVKYYTRGVSSPSNWVVGVLGSAPQMISWTAMMKGISESIKRRGGTPKQNSFHVTKYTKST
jgi:hypothetical protein